MGLLGFVSSVLGEEKPFSTFEAAFDDFYVRMKAAAEGGATRTLFSFSWIEVQFEGGGKMPLMLDDVKLVANRLGIMTPQGEIVSPRPSVNPEMVESLARGVAVATIASMQRAAAVAAQQAIAAIEAVAPHATT